MGFAVHVLVFGLMGLAFGVAELIAPNAVLDAFGVPLDASAVVMTRLGCGPLNVGFGLAAALTFRVRDHGAQLAILQAGLAYAAAATAVSVFYGLSDPAWRLMMGSMLLITIPLGFNATRLLLALRKRGPVEAAAQGSAASP